MSRACLRIDAAPAELLATLADHDPALLQGRRSGNSGPARRGELLADGIECVADRTGG